MALRSTEINLRLKLIVTFFLADVTFCDTYVNSLVVSLLFELLQIKASQFEAVQNRGITVII